MQQPVCEHEWGPERSAIARAGPMEGTWLIRECLHCSTFSVESVEAPELSMDAVLARLEQLGCFPRPEDQD
jgi:hypothetical protein